MTMIEYNLAISGYTYKLKQQLGLRTNLEPWLHVAISVTSIPKKNQLVVSSIVYVWDTREVIETRQEYKKPRSADLREERIKLMRSFRVKSIPDNAEPLQDVSNNILASIAFQKYVDSGIKAGIL